MYYAYVFHCLELVSRKAQFIRWEVVSTGVYRALSGGDVLMNIGVVTAGNSIRTCLKPSDCGARVLKWPVGFYSRHKWRV